jgi:hypothetical protein
MSMGRTVLLLLRIMIHNHRLDYALISARQICKSRLARPGDIASVPSRVRAQVTCAIDAGIKLFTEHRA